MINSQETLVEMNSTIWKVPKTWVSINRWRNVITRHNGILSNDVPLFEAAWMKLGKSTSFFMLLVVTYFRSIKELAYDHKFGFWKLRTFSRFVSDRFSLFLLLFLLLVWLFVFCFASFFYLQGKNYSQSLRSSQLTYSFLLFQPSHGGGLHHPVSPDGFFWCVYAYTKI